MSRTEVHGAVPSEGSSDEPPQGRRAGRRVRVIALVALAAVLVATAAALLITRPWTRDRTYDDPAAWRLVWSDEFTGSSLDPTRWEAEDRSTFGEANLELPCLMDRSENIVVADGEVALTARREDPALPCGRNDKRFPEGRDYSSAMISTQGLASWTYGRVEIRAALPTVPGSSEGMWPALWMRPDSLGAGEIDIMEALGTGADRAEAGLIHQTLHYDYSGTHPKKTTVPVLPEGFDPTQMHTYAVELRPERIDWLVDGEVTWTLDPDSTPWITEVLGTPYFLRMNLAVGGRWPGSPTAATTLPAAMRVDWVRVYQP